EQPAEVQTDRGACFVGADGGSRAAVPGRLTLWLWGFAIRHRILPPGKPYRNGAVERFNGAIERNWQGETDGLAALQTVWNHGKPAGNTGRVYPGRAGFQMEQVWTGLATVRVKRRVNDQGRLSLWDRPVSIGQAAAGTEVVVTFDAERRMVVIRDKRDRLIAERALTWLTMDWLWDGVDPDPRPCPCRMAPPAFDIAASSMFR
ncbi:MAG: hypothetical protein WBW04_11810, partial [Nitrolancea sp.]